ncbi:CRISPR-associated protein Cas8c/Csd1, subtype I-C/DVULG [Actinoalloteichus sp. GBA129-24]|uniref:CRISPR-associated protein Cas8c/Csd1, subtype I-C/DVULG n=2 Tax=Pseudonocardiaceae TaxID=2070 RepID=A0AAC9LDD5_9PSEU|nr:CRISPR-associated protein Cas8c/Csd1, subtype I-C/DVULG [Actinoalloteichus fjordicus]APU20783.1 CRISPR-associated protein Cas8c/Csd1, subtype I-C/DVULG [Actinoalloteichus sp. GBA129-24]
MLLQRLVQYAEETTDSAPFHREREFVWRIDLFSDGRPARLTDIREPDAKGRLRGFRESTPAMTRSIQVAAQLGADDVQYVLGWGDDTTKPDRVAQCHQQFIELVSAWADTAGHEPAAETVRAFYRDGDYTHWERPEGYGAKQGVLLAVDGQLLSKAHSAIRFWTDEVTRRKSGKDAAAGLCLVCGRHGALVKTIPTKIAARLVPGAGNDVALVSVNENVFGYGLTTSLAHTPICFTCGNAFSTGLTHLLGSEHAYRLPGQDSVMAWWVVGAPPRDVYDVMPRTADPGAVRRLLSRLRSGDLDRAAALADQQESSERFCSVTLGGNNSRIMVRDWIDMPLTSALRNLALWHEHSHMVSEWEDEPQRHGLAILLMATGRWEGSRYADHSSRSARRPEHIQRDLLARALRGVALPPSVPHHVLRRIGADGHIDSARAALLRLALCDPKKKEPSVTAGLDEKNQDTAYLFGRIFSVLEQIQYAASEGKLNATFGDRHLAGAVANPTPAVAAGRKLASAWLAKLRRRPNTRAKAVAFAETLDLIADLADASKPLPTYLPARRQMQFVLGYHQQRAHDREQARARKAAQS